MNEAQADCDDGRRNQRNKFPKFVIALDIGTATEEICPCCRMCRQHTPEWQLGLLVIPSQWPAEPARLIILNQTT